MAGQDHVNELCPREAAYLIDCHRARLIDVREPDEYAAERIPGSLLMPLSDFAPDKIPRDEERRTIFYCGTGKRSLVAAKRMLQAGFPSASHLKGGMAAWSAEGLFTSQGNCAHDLHAPSRT